MPLENPWIDDKIEFQVKAILKEDDDYKKLYDFLTGSIAKKVLFIVFIIVFFVFFYNRKAGNILSILSVFMFTLFWVILKATKGTAESKIKKINDYENYWLTVSEDKLYIPEFQEYGKAKDQNIIRKNGYIEININSICDFESVRGAKNIPKHFIFVIQTLGKRSSLKIINTLDKDEMRKFRSVLGKRFESMPDLKNPFSKKAHQQRKNKSRIRILLGVIGIISGVALTLSVSLFRPLLFWSALVQFFLLGLLPSVTAGYAIRQFYLNPYLEAKYGRKISPWYYYFTFIALGWSLVSVLNYFGPSLRELKTVVVKDKYYQTNKGGRTYYIKFNIDLDKTAYKFDLDKDSSAPVNRNIYDSVILGQSQVSIEYKKGFFNIAQVVSTNIID